MHKPVPGSVWKIAVEPGQRVAAGDTLVIVESMKMEMAVAALDAASCARCAAPKAGRSRSGRRCVVITSDDAEAAE